jgi:phenylacetate-CoA ligase
MIKTMGTTVYPPALYDILDSFSSIVNYVIFVTKNDIGLDEIKVQIGVPDESLIDINSIREHFRSRLRLVPEIILKTPVQINAVLSSHSGTKEQRFIDLR